MASKTRVGIGYDIHPLVPGRRLVLGGVDIPFERGLSGWSDADVLAHAIMDALLGAAALGDIGKHFPPGDPEYRDASSLKLLEKTVSELSRNGYKVVNIDATVLAERPKLKDLVDRMRAELGRVLSIGTNRVSIKATTSERLGFVGREEGIAAYAVALIEGGEDEDI